MFVWRWQLIKVQFTILGKALAQLSQRHNLNLFWDVASKQKYPRKAYPMKGYLVTKPLPEMGPRGPQPTTKHQTKLDAFVESEFLLSE